MARSTDRFQENRMKKPSLAFALLAFGLTSAQAQERVLDGVLGAVSGALVAGPVGLVAGGVVGATAGPAISSSWGLSGGHRHHRRHRHHY
jgi:hypothetical protein